MKSKTLKLSALALALLGLTVCVSSIINLREQQIEDARAISKERELESIKLELKQKDIAANKEGRSAFEKHTNKLKVLQSLTPKFNIKSDEFTGRKWAQHKKRWQGGLSQGYMYTYFQVGTDGKSYNLRFTLGHYAERWVFFKKVYFVIDGNRYLYTPKNKKRKVLGSGKISETFDDSVTSEVETLLSHLSTAKSVKIRLQGDDRLTEKKITKTQIQVIKETLELYKAMN